MRGLHNYVVRNCVAVKPLRAGAHSLVQARSFHYYGTLCLRPPSSPPTLRKIEHLLCSVFLLFVDEGLHNYVVRNCVAVKPLRAGVHSLVQTRSFHYYGTLCLRPPHLHHKKTSRHKLLVFLFMTGTH